MKIIFLAIAYQDTAISYSLYNDLMIELNKTHEVLVVAPVYTKGKVGIQIESGVKVIRVQTLPLFNVNKFYKGIANLLLPYQYRKALSQNNILMDFDLVIMPTPPISLINLAIDLKKKSRAQLYLILRDIFPQNAIDLDIMSKKSFVYRQFRKQEKKCYRFSDQIGCMSPANISYILKHNPEVDAEKLHLLPNWSSLPDSYQEEIDEKEIREKYNLGNKKVLLYGGNLGKPQKVENIIELARICTDITSAIFFIVGDGTERKKVEDLIAAYQLDNVKLIKKLPKYEYVKIVKMAYLGLISLNEKFTIPNFPSKVLAYMAAKKPVLASLDENTDFGDILEASGVGFWGKAGNPEGLKKLLLQMISNPERCKEMGEKGYQYMAANLLPEHAAHTIISHTEATQTVSGASRNFNQKIGLFNK